MKKWSFSKQVIIVSLLVLALPLAAMAAEVEDFKLKTTKDLFDLCSTQESDPKYVAAIHACHGYIAGAVHYHDALADGKKFKRLICYPPTAVMADAIMAYLKWCKDNLNDEKLMAEFPVIGVVRALGNKYPCKK